MEHWRAYAARWPYVSLAVLGGVFLWLVLVLLRPEAARVRHDLVGQAVETVVAETPVSDPAVAETPQAAVAASPIVAQEEKVVLSQAPDAAVSEMTATGPLPIIADDGRKPWQVYARPFVSDKAPHIAVIIAPVGGDQVIANTAIERVPGVVTLAIDAQASSAKDWLHRARQAGHETILMIPAEPVDYPASDPGVGALLSEQSASENVRRFLGFLRQGSGYIGVTTLSGSRFVGQTKALEPILDEVSRRGLAILDTKISPRSVLIEMAKQKKLPVAAIDFRLNADLSAAAIDQTLVQVQRQALQSGYAVCLVAATPLAIDRLNRWLVTLPQIGIRLAPLSAVLR
ncbi:MAG: divergent polysaccharide deacetylase family protein [Alphaproteobacteria bacterium]